MRTRQHGDAACAACFLTRGTARLEPSRAGRAGHVLRQELIANQRRRSAGDNSQDLQDYSARHRRWYCKTTIHQ